MYSQLLAIYLTLNGRLTSCLFVVLLIGTLAFVVYRLIRWTTVRSERDFFVALVLCMVSAFCVAGHLNRFASLLYLSSLPAQRVVFHQDPLNGYIVVSERGTVPSGYVTRDTPLYRLRLDPKSFMLLWPVTRSFYVAPRPLIMSPPPRDPRILTI
jgi:hypothetical protein